MSTRSLNHFLGRSKIDPAVLEAFYAGRIKDLIAEYDFAPELMRLLTAIEAPTFAEYAERAFRAVTEHEWNGRRSIPDPKDGLEAAGGRLWKDRVA